MQTRISRRRYINKLEDTVLTDLLRLSFDLFETTIRAVYRFFIKYMFATISSEEISQKAIGVNFFASFLPYIVSLKEFAERNNLIVVTDSLIGEIIIIELSR